MQPKKIATFIREFADDKKAEDIVVLDVAKISTLTRYFVITHGNNSRHVKAIAENVRDELKKKGTSVWHVEGMGDGNWVVLDYGSVILHVFYKEVRQFYGLERLWGEAKRI